MRAPSPIPHVPHRYAHRARILRFGGLVVACLLLLMMLPLPTADAAPTSMPLGMDMGSVSKLKAEGAAPRYGSYWVGPWVSGNWGHVEDALRTGVNTGTTPVIYWYYWGDSISPSCVDRGCDGRSQAQWTSMTQQLADRIRSIMQGRETIVVLENEFNKGGIDGSYASTFDTKLEAVAKTLKGVSGVKLVLGFGAWGESNWVKFPKSAALSDYIGFQMMRASTKDSESSYRAAATRIQALTSYAQSKFNRPSFLYDLALSSYPDAHWQKVQSETLSAVFDSLVTAGGSGLQGVVYRTLSDNPNIDPKNYYGYAERHWGLKTSTGAAKPSWWVWKAKATGGGAPSTPTAFSATFSDVKVQEWWVQTSVSASKPVASVEARVAGGAWTPLAKQSWGGWAKSLHVLAGQTVEFRAVATDGATAVSSTYGRDGAPPPSSGFTASFTGVKVQEWWVQTSVASSKPLSKVEARVAGGVWTPLAKQSWGGWAKSLHVLAGESVEFRAVATDGSSATSPTFTRGGTPSAPAGVTFTGIKVQEWWVQTSISSSKSIAKVEARVAGGAWVALDKQSWGGWAKSLHVLSGQSVEFRATATDGTSTVSAPTTR